MQKPQSSHKLREFISVSWGCSPTYGVLPRSGARAEIHNTQVMVMMMVIMIMIMIMIIIIIMIMMMVFVVMMFVIIINIATILIKTITTVARLGIQGAGLVFLCYFSNDRC